MKTLIIGAGEIGHSLYNVLSKEYPCELHDPFKNEFAKGNFDIMHVSIPYSDNFIKIIKGYKALFKPKYVVIHSTVPIGTSRKCNAIHSPVTGIHPNLDKSLTTFTKFLGGKQASEVAQYFRRANIKIYITDKSETTELIKILCTTYYGVNIEFTKEVKRACDKYDIPFELWTLWNNNYNEGYSKLGFPEYARQNLVPMMTKIGGHCILNNSNLLDMRFTRLLKEMNKDEKVVSKLGKIKSIIKPSEKIEVKSFDELKPSFAFSPIASSTAKDL